MLLLISLAASQTVDGDSPDANGQLFRPSIDSTHTIWTDDTSKAPDGYFLARGVVHYARDPVIYVQDDTDDVTRIVGDLFQLSLLGGYTKGPIRLGVDVPIFLRTLGSTGDETGLGDVAIDIKGTLVDRTDNAVGLALGGRASLPTATVDAPLGNRGFGWELQGIVDKEVDALLVTGNLGVKGVPKAELENFTLGTQLVARLGGGYALTDNAGLSLDFGSHINLVDPVPEAIPVEGILGGWGRVNDFVMRGGIGTGLTGGFGAPRFRAILGFAYEPPRAKDSDGDGIVDADDQCPNEPEDFDGFQDIDGCPEPTMVAIAVVDPQGEAIDGATYQIADPESGGRAGTDVGLPGGSYSVSLTADGYVPLDGQRLEVPDAERHSVTYTLKKDIKPAQLTVKIVGEDGTPIDGGTWSLRLKPLKKYKAASKESFNPGTYNIRGSAEGYRPQTQEVVLADGADEIVTLKLKPAKVQLTKERIDIKDSVYFETAKAVIKSESFELLDEVAQIINEHPELVKIQIEGHTDSRGSAAYNLGLSKERAASVRNYLIGKSVSAGRLTSEGYGEGKPIAQGNNEAAWSKNRRVDFFVTERSDD